MITFMNLTSKGSILLSPKGKSIYTKNRLSGKCPCPKSPVENCYPSWMPNFLDASSSDKFNFCALNFDGQDYVLPLESAYDSSLTSRWYDPSDVNPDYCDDLNSENYNADWKSKYNNYYFRQNFIDNDIPVDKSILEAENYHTVAQALYKGGDETNQFYVCICIQLANKKGLTVVNNSPCFYNRCELYVQHDIFNEEKARFLNDRIYYVIQNNWTSKPIALLDNEVKIAGRNYPFQINNFEFSKHVNGTKILLHEDLSLKTFDQDYCVMSIPAGDTYGSQRRYWNTEKKDGNGQGTGEKCDDDWNTSVTVTFGYDESIKANCWVGYDECGGNYYIQNRKSAPPVEPTNPENPDSPNNPNNNPPSGDSSNPDSPANPDNPNNPNNPNNPIPPDSPVNPNNPNYDPSLDPTIPPSPPPAPETLSYCYASFSASTDSEGNWIVTFNGTGCAFYEDLDWSVNETWVTTGAGGCSASYSYLRIGDSGCDENTCNVDTTPPSIGGLPVCIEPEMTNCIFSWIATCLDGVTTVQEVSGYPITTELTEEQYTLVNGVTFGSWVNIPCETDGMEMWSYTSYETTSGNCSFPEAPSTAGLSCGNYVRIANFMQWIPEATVTGYLTTHNAYNAYELVNNQAQLKYDQREGKPVTCIYYSEIVKGLPLTSSSSESDAWFSSYYDAHQVPSGTARNNFYGENITDETIFYNITPIVRGFDPCPYDWRGFINEYKIKDSYAYLTTQGFMPSTISSNGWVNRVYGQNIPLEFHSVSNALHWMKVTRYSIDPNNTDIMNYQFPLKEDFSTSLFNGNPDYNFIKTDNFDIMGMSEEEAYRSTTILGYYECVSTSSLLTTNACSETINTDIMYQCDGGNCTEIYRSDYAQGHREEKSIYYNGDIYGYLEAIGATTLYNKNGGDCNNTTFNNKIYARIAEYGDSNSATQANIHPVSSSNPAEFDDNPNDLYYQSSGAVSFGVCANKQVYTTSTCYDMDWNWIPCPS